MPLAALVCAGFGLLGMGDDPAPSRDVPADYPQVRAAAGRSPAEQVRLALWCEAHGLSAERARHLTLALLADPGNAMARGLAGLGARDGRWVAPPPWPRPSGPTPPPRPCWPTTTAGARRPPTRPTPSGPSASGPTNRG